MTDLIEPVVNSAIPDKRERLRRLLQGTAITKSNLSPEQLRLWFLCQLAPDNPCNDFSAFEISGRLDFDLFQICLNEIVKHNEMLRAKFVEIDGVPVRVTIPKIDKELTLTDLTTLNAADRENEIDRIGHRNADTVMPLDSSCLWRMTVVRLSPDRHIFMIVTHKIIADRLSHQALVRQLAAVYDGSGVDARSFNGVAQYTDFLLRQRGWFQSEEFQRRIAYWHTRMGDFEPPRILTDHPRTSVNAQSRSIIATQLPDSFMGRLEALAAQLGTQPFTLLAAALQIVITRITGQSEVSIGTPGIGWSGETRADVCGPLTDILVIKTDLPGNSSFERLVVAVHAEIESTRENGGVPFANLVEDIQPGRSLGVSPLFQVFFEYAPDDYGPIAGRLLTFRPTHRMIAVDPFDLTVRVVRLEQGASVRLEYNADLFESVTVARIRDQYLDMLEALLVNPFARPDSVSLLNSEDLGRHYGGHVNAFDSTGKSLHQIFEEQAYRSPDRIAVFAAGCTLTYRDLNERANQLAHHLRSLGVSADDRVGICVDRSLEMIVGLLGVLKAGGAYVPLDPDYPSDRLAFLLEDSRSAILLTQQRLIKKIGAQKAHIIRVDCWDQEHIASRPTTNPNCPIDPNNLAYVIYTSGSSGTPKGVLLTHAGIVNNLMWRQRAFPLGETDRMLQTYSFSFDPSVWAIFWPLSVGAQLVLIQSGEHYDASALIRMMREHQITVYGAAPTLQNVLFDEKGISECRDLRYIFCGGESLSTELVHRFQTVVDARVVNVYGPTETTIDATYWICPQTGGADVIPIGNAIDNASAYVLDSLGNPVSIGSVGELCIGGIGLARGYYQRPDLTAEKFVPDSFSATPGARLYRTGDLARYRFDGTIECLGRIDDQVKLRGYRIELGEIEAQIKEHQCVNDAVVVMREDTPGDTRLVAYVVSSNSASEMRQALETFLEQRLPRYMLPSSFVFLDHLPLSANGKCDRKILPPPSLSMAESKGLVAPRSAIESDVARIFANVLKLERVSIADSFFDLGGNSLQVAKLASQLSNNFNLKLAVHQIFEMPTVVGISHVIEVYQREGLTQEIAAWNNAQLDAEVVLDASIDAHGLVPGNLSDPEAIFLTGATGYLGAFLLERLIRETSAKIYCLVRAETNDQARQRIEETLRYYRLWNELFTERIVPVVGDLSKPLLGLSASEFEWLAATIDSIYHNGALVNFAYPYSAMKAPNVLGTQEILRLASREKLKLVHYISTIDVFLTTHSPRPYLEGDLSNPIVSPNGYPRSKWVAEKIVALGKSRGIPVCVFRPGLMMSHAQSGASHSTDYLLVMLKGFLDLGIMPDYDWMVTNIIPVDYAAEAIIHLSLQDRSVGKFFHLWNQKCTPLGTLYEWINSFGYEFEILPHAEICARIADLDSDHPLFPLIPIYFQNLNTETSSSTPAWDERTFEPLEEMKNTIDGTVELGLECPQFDEQLLHRCFSFLIDAGFLPPPSARNRCSRVTHAYA